MLDYFAKMRKMEMECDKRVKDVDVMPGRAATRANALVNLKKLALKIKSSVEKRAKSDEREGDGVERSGAHPIEGCRQG